MVPPVQTAQRFHQFCSPKVWSCCPDEASKWFQKILVILKSQTPNGPRSPTTHKKSQWPSDMVLDQYPMDSLTVSQSVPWAGPTLWTTFCFEGEMFVSSAYELSQCPTKDQHLMEGKVVPRVSTKSPVRPHPPSRSPIPVDGQRLTVKCGLAWLKRFRSLEVSRSEPRSIAVHESSSSETAFKSCRVWKHKGRERVPLQLQSYR